MFLTWLLIFLFLSAVLMNKACRSFSVKELRRRARNKDNKQNGNIYKVSAYGDSLYLLLWIIGGISGAILLIKAVHFASWFAVLLVLFASWLVLMNQRLRMDGILWTIASYLAPVFISLLNFLQPVLSKLTRNIKNLKTINVHTGLYDKEDLLDLINKQNHQLDNRIAEEDLKVAYGALTFGDLTVDKVMTPRRKLKLVAASDAIGPLLMDELHASGFSRFPVTSAPTKSANPEIIGTLYLHDLVGHSDKGKVRDVMKSKVYFINETQNLRQALDAFLRTQHHLLVVVNNFEEITGVITLEDVLEQVIGSKIVDEFDKYEDLRAVASIEAIKEQGKHSVSEVVE
jgi:CBS domain containing-hemolysin-like protein